MISLKEFILESSYNRRILNTVDEVVEFFNLDKNDDETIQLIEKFFDNAPEKKDGSKVSPFVAEYNSRKSWCFRRWCQNNPHVEDVVDKFKDKVKDKYKFKDYHNTNLEKIDGFPSSSEQEYLVAMSLNIKALSKDKAIDDDIINKSLYYALFGEELKNGEKIDDKKKAVFDKYMDYYKQHNKFINEWPENVDVKENDLYTKCLPTGKVSDDWSDYGAYNNTPKTDIISKSGNKISLKQCGGAQAMSGGFNETMATLLSYEDLLSDDKDKESLHSLFFNKDGSVKDWKGKDSERNKDLDEVIQTIFKKKENKKFIIAVLSESMTGDTKFGKDSDSVPNQVISWDLKNELIQDDINDYIYNAYKEISEGVKKKSFTISHKSSGKAWSVLRIFLPKHYEKVNISEKEKNEYDEIMKNIKNSQEGEIKKKERVELKDEDGKIIKVAIHTGPKGGHFYISPKTKNPVYVEKGDTGEYAIKSK